MADLERRAARGAADPAVLLLFDLDGFKSYNDAFGHLAGDALLTRLGQALDRSVQAPRARLSTRGRRVLRARRRRRPRARSSSLAPAALAEHGDGFAVTASYGAVAIPQEAPDRERGAAHRRPAHVRAQELRPRHGPAPEHRRAPARPRRAPSRPRGPSRRRGPRSPSAVGRHLGLEGEELDHVRVAAELHDVGKVAIPDAILNKPGPLDDDEWAFMRRHTLIGERIVAAAPALGAGRQAGARQPRALGRRRLPRRASAGEDIPLGARIVAVCDAYDAIVADRPYRRGRSAAEAMAELRPLRRHAVRPGGGGGLRRGARGRRATPARPRPPSPRAAR